MTEKPVDSEKKAKKHPTPIYFRPDQLLFHVNGNVGSEGADTELIRWANRIAQESGITISLLEKGVFDFPGTQGTDQEKASTFSPSETNLPSEAAAGQVDLGGRSRKRYKSPVVKEVSPFSFVFAKVESEHWPTFVIKPFGEVGEEDQKAQMQAMGQLLDLAIFLDNQRETAPVDVAVVSPNWLISGSRPSEPGGTGGPGGRPTPFAGPTVTDQHEFVLRQEIQDLYKNGQGENVTVAILDTAYQETELIDRKPKNGSHPLYEALLGANRRLHIHYDPSVENYMPGITTEDHDYDMRDHGLFVAGIINSLAPQAELHLYHVLNKYGLGDLQTIASAMQKVYDAHARSTLVVNSSLTINLPLEAKHLRYDDDEMGKKLVKMRRLDSDDEDSDELDTAKTNAWKEWLDRQKVSRKEIKDWLNRQNLPAEQICDLTYALGSRVIAAAGNNRDEKIRPGRPNACYLAAFESVLGVGALPISELPAHINDQLKTASYSNKSDRPLVTGITTLGGEAGEKQGVLGIYLGQFPPPSENELEEMKENKNGWAWWAGTSFATPIVSGITAAILSSKPNGSRTEEAISELFDAQLWETEDNEDVLYVTQRTSQVSP
jgi:hypothetical protein